MTEEEYIKIINLWKHKALIQGMDPFVFNQILTLYEESKKEVLEESSKGKKTEEEKEIYSYKDKYIALIDSLRCHGIEVLEKINSDDYPDYVIGVRVNNNKTHIHPKLEDLVFIKEIDND